MVKRLVTLQDTFLETDLTKIKKICEQNETQTPTEMKMYYDVKSGKYKADYKYD